MRLREGNRGIYKGFLLGEIMFVCFFFVEWGFFSNNRLCLPGKPRINRHALGPLDDYCELTSKFKAAHVKILLWWVAGESQKWADMMPNDSDL